MNSITPINLGQSAAASPSRLSDIQQRPETAAAGASTLSGAAPGKTAPASDMMGMNLVSAISDALEGLGGGQQDNQILRMLMGLIILMAMLTQQSENNDAGSGLQQQLDGGGQGGMFVQQSFTSLSISIEQTSVTSLTFVPQDAFSGGEGTQDSGGQIDLAV